MSEIPKHNPENREVLDDNARKFVTGPIDPRFLEENSAKSFDLVVDWLETGDDNEKKVAYKKFDNGEVQILLISKITKDGKRTSEKEKITDEKYQELLGSSILHLEKRRHEFEYVQNGITFSMKYDEFEELCLLEVDAPNEEKREAFQPGDFPNRLDEVTGDMRYYGYRMANIV
jgi:hypothetical protein